MFEVKLMVCARSNGRSGRWRGEVSLVGAASVVETRDVRLHEARGLLERAAGTWGGQRASALSGDAGRTWPVAAPLRSLFPGGGLRKGSTVAVDSPGALLLALLAEASADGAWCGLVGMPRLGLVAAAEAGLVLSRVALVPRPGRDLVAVTSMLLDGLDVVVVAGGERLRAGDRQRLAGRARQRGALLVAVGRWAGADLEISAGGGRWRGLADAGAGRLRSRPARVRVRGRGAAYRERTATMLLPGPCGTVAAASPGAGLPGAWPATSPSRLGAREAG